MCVFYGLNIMLCRMISYYLFISNYLSFASIGLLLNESRATIIYDPAYNVINFSLYAEDWKHACVL